MSSLRFSTSVHPHTSGEYELYKTPKSGRFGSSPHKWGILSLLPLLADCLRFIPTQVGNTKQGAAISCSPSVHPHTSGEYLAMPGVGFATNGSSPHKWGIQRSENPYVILLRFIPTQVGNTLSLSSSASLQPVHPHTSGEYVSGICRASTNLGSSPHKWGIRVKQSVILGHSRFIPTQVGNTSPRSSKELIASVHPHTSGEYHNPSSTALSYCGSSPHKWGILSV